MAKDIIITPASGTIEFKDGATRLGRIYESNGNVFFETTNDLVIGDGSPADVEFGALNVPVSLTLLGGGSFTGGGNTIDIGSAGDTINLNVAGVTYNMPTHSHLISDIVNLQTTLSSFVTGSYVSTQISTAIANLIDSAPGTLDTLNELAAALGDDPNFATTITNALAGKLSTSGKAADSNLLDGIDSASFLRSDAADTFSAILTGTATGENLKIGGIRGTTKGSQTGEYIHLYERVHIGGPNGWGASTHGAPSQGLSVWGSVDFGMNGTGVIQLDGTTILTATRQLTNVTNTNWDAAYSWGNHAGLYAAASHTHSEYLTTTGKAADSNLLDGIDSSSFLRSDANDTFTGALTIVGDIRGSGQQLVLNAGESYAYATGQTDEYVYVNAEQGLMVSTTPDNWSSLWAGRQTTIITGSSISVGGNTVWHTGNFNPASYLLTTGKAADSNLLDGIDSTGFMRAANANGYYGLARPSDGDTSDWIRTTANGLIPFTSGGYSSLGTSSWPFNTIYGVTVYENNTALSSKYLGISATAANSSQLLGSTWISTNKTVRWDSGYGYHGNPRSMAIGYSGGNYGQFGYGLDFTSTSGVHTYAIADVVTRVDMFGGLIVYGAPSGTVGTNISWTETFKARYNESAPTFKGNTIWHAGNDGAGSGLDADTLDGLQASAFATSAQGAKADTALQSIAANSIGASELNVSGNGTTSQYLRSDGDGSFSWVTPPDTNTTYSAGTGLTLSGTTFSVTAGTYAAASHTHDDRYYTETESDNRYMRADTDANTAGAIRINGSYSYGTYTAASNYKTGADNLVLKGNANGVSGIFFESEKDGTNINHPSDFGFIQYSAYGTGTSGESNELVIGVSNDADDHLVLNAPDVNGLKFRTGASTTDNTVYHSGNLTLATLGYTGATNANYITNNNQLANGAGYITSSGSISGNAATATLASTVTINYNNNSNSTYQMLWGSGTSVYGTGSVYLNPSTNYVYASSFNAGDWFRSSGATGWYNSTYGGGWYMTDSSYVRPYNNKSIHLNNQSIDYVSQLHFNDNVRFYDEGNNQYLNFKWGNTGAGGIKFVDGDTTVQGYVYGSGGGSFGLLDANGNWRVRVDTANVEIYGTLYASTVHGSIFYDANNSNYYLDPNGTSVLGAAHFDSGILDNASARIYMPGGAYNVNNSSGTVGAIRINLPTAVYGSNTMMSMTVQVYEYSTGQSFTIRCGGYNYYTHSWYNEFAFMLSDSGKGGDVPVYFGNDGTRDVIWIGNPDWSWSYPNVFVTDFQAGHSQNSNWKTGWSVSFDTAARTNVTSSRTAYRQIDLGNYAAHLDSRYYTESEVNSLLSSKANLASPALTGTPTAPTASAATNNTQIATTAYVTTAINNLINSAPGALNTLDELAAALGDDANFATNVTNSIATKVPLSGEAALSGMKKFETNVSSQDDWQNSPVSILERDGIGSGSSSDIYAPNLNFHWRNRVSRSLWMAYDGGLHYGEYSGSGVPGDNGTFYVGGGNSSQWNAAYSWGNHANAGYTSNTGTVTSVSGTGSYGGLSLSGTVTGSGNITLGGTPTGTWPISVSGNAATATSATSATSAGTWTTARTITIGNTGKSVNGSGNVSWSLAEIGAQAAGSYAAASHNHDGVYLPIGGKAADSNLLDGLDSSRFLYTTTGQFSGDWNTLTDGDQEIRLVEVHNITGGAHSNYPTGIYPYGSVLGWQLDNATFKMYASHTGDIAMQTGWNNDGYSGWMNVITSRNIGSQSVNYAATAGSAPANGGNSTTVAGLSVHTGRNNEADKVVRTDVNGYIQAGWINTTSGDNGTTGISRIYASHDGYIRYYTAANFISQLGLITTSSIGSQSVNYATTAGSASSSPLLSALGDYVFTAATNGRSFSRGIQTSFVSASQGYPEYGSVVRIATYSGLNDGGTAELYFPYGASYGGSSMRYRLGLYNNGGWTGWKTVVDSDNIGSQSVNYANSAGSVPWSGITSVPSTFTPSAHNQAWSTITSTPTTLAGYGITDALGTSTSGSISFTGNSTIRKIFIDRSGGTASGISWYSSGYTSWATYMGSAGQTGLGATGNITAPSGTYVTAWALRNFIENAGGYGWTWEAGTSTGQPSVVAELSSSSGNFRTVGTIYASGGNSSEWNSAYSERYRWDGGASGINAATGRASLGLGTAATSNTGDFAAASHSHTFASLTSKPTTISGYGITDAITTGNIGSQSVSYSAASGTAGTSLSTSRGIIEDTRSAQRTPNDYDDYRVSFEFTNQMPHDSNWLSIMTMQGWSNGYNAWQIQGPATSSDQNSWYLRSGRNTTWGTANLIIHSGNISSQSVSYANSAGSATNADTVDSLHASSFLRSDTTNSVYRVTAGDGNRIQFWDSTNYAIWMSSTGNSTWGGRLDTTSDYNMYFKMSGGTNRGFVFKNSTTDVAQIAGDGTIYTASHGNSSNWKSAYDWGNHANAGYLTSVPAQSFASLTGKPTTLAGYGITDAATSGHNHDSTYLGISATAADSNKLGGIAASSYSQTSHNHTYNVNDAWLRDNGDNANVKLYGNSRQMVFRTDGTTEYAAGVGGYAFAWMYGGDAASNRRMLMDTSGNIWTNSYGWLHSYFQAAGSAINTGNIGSQSVEYSNRSLRLQSSIGTWGGAVTFNNFREAGRTRVYDILGYDKVSSTNPPATPLQDAAGAGAFNYGTLLSVSGDYAHFEIYMPNNTSNTVHPEFVPYFRTGYQGGWSNWSRLVTSVDNTTTLVGNDGTALVIDSQVGWSQAASAILELNAQSDDWASSSFRFMAKAPDNMGTQLLIDKYTVNGGWINLGYVDKNADNNLYWMTDVIQGFSDNRLKTNVNTLTGALEIVLQIRAVTFDWDPEMQEYHRKEGSDLGFIAQEIEELLPEVVVTRPDGYKTVKYEKVVPVLVEAIKEQQATINALIARIEALENK